MRFSASSQVTSLVVPLASACARRSVLCKSMTMYRAEDA